LRQTSGCWRVLVDGQTVDEGIFYGDDFPAADLATLPACVAGHPADTPEREPLRLLSLRPFRAQVLWKLAYKGRALVVGFNLPFDFGRLAVGWGTARGDYYGGGSRWSCETTNGTASGARTGTGLASTSAPSTASGRSRASPNAATPPGSRTRPMHFLGTSSTSRRWPSP
jgi:hypothetical protein